MRLLRTLVVASMLAIGLAPAMHAGAARSPSFDRVALLSPANGTIHISGRVSCDLGPNVRINIWFTQKAAGTSGTFKGACLQTDRTFSVDLPSGDIQKGSGTAQALASGRSGATSWKQNGVRVEDRETHP